MNFVLSSSVPCILIGQAKSWYHNAHKTVLKSMKMCCLSNKCVSYSVCAHWRPIICFGAAIKDNWWMYISCLEPVWLLSTEPSLCPISLQYESIVAVCTRDTMIWMTYSKPMLMWSRCKAVLQNSTPCQRCQLRHSVQTRFLFLTVCLTSATQRMSDGHKYSSVFGTMARSTTTLIAIIVISFPTLQEI